MKNSRLRSHLNHSSPSRRSEGSALAQSASVRSGSVTQVEKAVKLKDPQVADYLRLERKGVCSISAIASKAPSQRDSVEKQYFTMFLKMRVPFFLNFDKKTIKLIMERINCQWVNRN